MRYWPLTEIAAHLHHTQVWEIMCAFNAVRMSESTLMACNRVAGLLEPSESPLYVIESTDCSKTRAYHTYPEFADWLKLERAGFVATDNFFGLVIDRLH